MCPDCIARRKLARDALLRSNIIGAATHVAKGVAEAAGIKEKTGTADLKTSRAQETPAKPVNRPLGQETAENAS